MDTLPRLRARIESLGELRELVKAMRGHAATHAREGQDALTAIRRYAEIVAAALARAATLATSRDGAAARGPAVTVVLCAEHGFVGGFNERLLDAVVAGPANGMLGIVGRRGAQLAAERRLAVDWDVAMATHVDGVLTTAQRIAERIVDAATVDVVFTAHRDGGDYAVQRQRLLPAAGPTLAATEAPPVHYLPPAMLLERLAAEYLFAGLAHVVMESFASENGARLRAMEAADRNIGDRLEGLRGEARTRRQEEITTELLDIVTGAQAILDDPRFRAAD